MSNITITKEGSRWIARFPFDWTTKDRVKDAGFVFSPSEKLWYTTDPSVAARLNPKAADEANRQIAASRSTKSAGSFPAPEGLDYLPYQKAGIQYALDKPAVLLADEMGLGKTIQAIGLINSDPTIKHVLVICPASLKINWLRELNKWLVKSRAVEICNGSFPSSDIVILNYDILKKWRSQIDARKWDLLIVDECHMVKNPKAQRTKLLLGTSSKREAKIPGIAARKKLFLTGTPIVNRPIELWPLLHALDPNGIGRSFWSFTQRYCDAVNNGYGWDFSGASNLPELQQRLRATVMVRRLKTDVLKELPPKRRQIVVVPPNGAEAIIARERDVFASHKATVERLEKAAKEAQQRGDKDGYIAAVNELHAANKVKFAEMAKVRHDTAVAKIPYVIEHLKECLEATDKLVVFAHHHDVMNAIKAEFPTAALVTGETAVVNRTLEVDRFQNDPNCRLFIGSIRAAGLGLTLTAASHVVFAELDWTPSMLSQAEDRCHRIGQDDKVLVQHLVFDDSMDSYMASITVNKQNIADAGLDTRGAQIERPTMNVAPKPPTMSEPAIVSNEPPDWVTENIGDDAPQLKRFIRADKDEVPF